MHSGPVIDVVLVDGPVAPDAATPPPGLVATCGGETVFVGRTRAEEHESLGTLTALHYDAYRPMAAAVIETIAHEEAARAGCAFVGVRHTVGRAAVGEATVLVRAVARGRVEAFEVCRRVIDRVKSEAPIWKREEWARGATWREDASLVGREEGSP